MSFSMQQIDRIRGSRVNLSIGHRTVFWQSRELVSLAIRTATSCSVPNFGHNRRLHSEGL
jgi:hypothetical protein